MTLVCTRPRLVTHTLISLVFMIVSFATLANAQGGATRHTTAANNNPTSVGSFVAAANKNALKVTLKASRDQAIAGSDFGITAQIENTSDLPVYIAPSSFAMTAPPELDSEGPRDWLAFFPGFQPITGGQYQNTVIVLEPGSNVSAFWSGNIQHSGGRPPKKSLFSSACMAVAYDCSDLLRSLSFSPGKYTLTIVGSYWDTYEGAKAKSVERHTQATELLEQINAPQPVILFGAAIGGIIAFLLLTKVQPSAPSGWARVRWIPGLLSAVLLSMIVTILLARLSQSQFIISVTVNDFWGAVAVGFIIAASGPTILQKFTTLVRGSAPASTITPTSSATPALNTISFVDPATATPNATVSLKLEGSSFSLDDTRVKLFSNTVALRDVSNDGTVAYADVRLPVDYDPAKPVPVVLNSAKTGEDKPSVNLPAAE